MKTSLNAVLLALVTASCTHSDDAQVGTGGVEVRMPAAAAALGIALHPPVAADADDGRNVYEYY